MKLYYDLHIHSALSPCGDKDMTPNNIVNMSIIKGLDVIAVTDHNSCGNVRAVMEVAGDRLLVIPGMEVETSEEVHVVCYFADIENAEKMGEYIKKHMSGVKNQEEIFGEQLYMDADDNVIGKEENLLVTATDLNIFRVVEKAKEFGILLKKTLKDNIELFDEFELPRITTQRLANQNFDGYCPWERTKKPLGDNVLTKFPKKPGPGSMSPTDPKRIHTDPQSPSSASNCSDQFFGMDKEKVLNILKYGKFEPSAKDIQEAESSAKDDVEMHDSERANEEARGDDESQKKELKQGLLFIPTATNFPTVDMFLIVKGRFIGIQTTTAEKHSLNARGLMGMWNACQSLDMNLKPEIVFSVPDTPHNRMCWKKRMPLTSIPSCTDDIKKEIQYFYEQTKQSVCFYDKTAADMYGYRDTDDVFVQETLRIIDSIIEDVKQ